MSLCVMLVIWLRKRGRVWHEHQSCQWEQFELTGWLWVKRRAGVGWWRNSLSDSAFVRLPEVFDGQRSPEVPQDLQQDPGPVTSVAQLPQIRQRLLRRTDCTLQLRQLITCTRSSNNTTTVMIHLCVSLLSNTHSNWIHECKNNELSELMFLNLTWALPAPYLALWTVKWVIAKFSSTVSSEKHEDVIPRWALKWLSGWSVNQQEIRLTLMLINTWFAADQLKKAPVTLFHIKWRQRNKDSMALVNDYHSGLLINLIISEKSLSLAVALTQTHSNYCHGFSLTKSYEELPVASALVRRQCENTRHIIPVRRLFLLKNSWDKLLLMIPGWGSLHLLCDV